MGKKKEEHKGNLDLTRRDILKIPAVALGAIACGSSLSSCGSSSSSAFAAGSDPANTNTPFASLPVMPLYEPLDPNEMRITFLGTSCIPRLSQECNSIFVEVGNAKGQADQFVFDCGSGVVAKYQAMGIPFSKMDKIFLTHIHGDHISDLTHIYCFGPSVDRKTPLYVFGPSRSLFTYNIPGGGTRGPFNDGLMDFLTTFRQTMRWHTESFSFLNTRDGATAVKTKLDWGTPADPVQVGDDNPTDGFALYGIEVGWQTNPGVAYSNPASGVTITHFPAIHCRMGSISYKLTWNGLSMIFTGDTKPNKNVLAQAPGVDVLIHEMVVPAEVWASKNTGLQPGQAGFDNAKNVALQVQNSSHTPQGAFGYILSKLNPRPRLTVATHFQAEDDTIASATQSVRAHTLTGNLAFASDLMVLNVSRSQIRQRKGVVSNFAFYPPESVSAEYHALQTPIYHNPDGTINPYAQIDPTDEIPQTDSVTGNENWRTDGY